MKNNGNALSNRTMEKSQFSRRSFLKAAALAGSLGVVGCSSFKSMHFSQQETYPNILFIIADDIGWADVGYHDSEIMTPNIDKLAKQGVVFNQHYVMASCSPTRCCLLSGRYASRFGVMAPTNEPVFSLGQVTLASVLKEAGYETFLSGKWHLGSSPEVCANQYGFDHSYGSLAGGVTAYGHFYKKGSYSKTWHRDCELLEEEGHVTDLIGQDVVRNIHKAAGSKNPFFIYAPFTAPHHPIQEEQKWIDLYEGKIADVSRRKYAACVTHLDATIGSFLDALEKTGQRENTIIIFTSDNGGEHGYVYRGLYPGIDESFSMPVEGMNVPLKGWKTTLYEGGIRVPALINWPGKLKAGTVKSPVHVVDWLPTLCSVAGCNIGEDLALDGQNIWPDITGQRTQPEERTLYWRTPGQVAIRQGDFKLIVGLGKDQKLELYNLEKDPFEKENLASQYPNKVKHLQSMLEEEIKRDKNP